MNVMRAKWILFFLLVVSPVVGAMQAGFASAVDAVDLDYVAPVKLDGKALFRVRGISAMPAKDRAGIIQERIVKLAGDPAVDPAELQLQTVEQTLELRYRQETVMVLHPVDAELEAVPLSVLADSVRDRLIQAIIEYREQRTPERVLRNTGILLGVSLVAGLLWWGVIVLFRWFDRIAEKQVKRHIEQLAQASHRVVDSRQLWDWVRRLLRTLRTLVIVVLVLLWLETAFGLYPWTRPLAADFFPLLLEPLMQMGHGLVDALPDLLFLAVLVFLVRLVLRLTRTFFIRLERGWIRLESLDRELALPTYRIIRILIIVFALVIAYPYIPGSDSEAFKGMSIFFGVILSIGSSSFIANMIAGYSLIYRRAFRPGDRVRIGDMEAEILEMRTLNTRLKSYKNEEINIPNSIVLSSAIVNYSTFQQEPGLILHTEVGIGYDVSWRRVEAMLLEAASRTEGLNHEPAPFVLQQSMDDFTVLYQLNAYCNEAGKLNRLRSALHANIQDVFNEQGVQIMSPHYVGDTPQPKIVPPEHW